MITLKTKEAIANMRLAGAVVYDALQAVKAAVRPGVSTWELDQVAEDVIRKAHAKPSFKGYDGFPATICASIDEEVVHGIPSKDRILREGQILSIDCGAIVNGYHGDSALTVGVGEISPEAALLIERTERSFWEALRVAKDGMRLGDIGHAVQSYTEAFGYGVVRALCGHGIGREMHEDPQVPNYGKPGTGQRLHAGMTIAIEPMIALGRFPVEVGADGWCVTTKDHSIAAHYEHTVLITHDEPIILTIPEGKKKDL